MFLENSCSQFFKMWEKIIQKLSKIFEKMPVNEFIFSKVQPATLQTLQLYCELLHRYFSRLLPTLQEYLFSGTFLNSCSWDFTERYFRTSCNKFYYLFPYIKTMEWNKRRQNFNGQIKKPHTCKSRWNWSSSKCTWQTRMLS